MMESNKRESASEREEDAERMMQGIMHHWVGKGGEKGEDNKVR